MGGQLPNHECNKNKSEMTHLLPHHESNRRRHGSSQDDCMIPTRWSSKIGVLLTTACAVFFGCVLFLENKPISASVLLDKVKGGSDDNVGSDQLFTLPPQIEHLIGGNQHETEHHQHYLNDDNTTYLSRWVPRTPSARCEHVMELFRLRDEGMHPLDLKMRYLAQSVDPNVFYRATAFIFWADFVERIWVGNFTSQFLLHNDPDSDDSRHTLNDDPENKQTLKNAPLTRKSVWTWVTGDQHLSNFGGRYMRQETDLLLHLHC
jgi:hypothetical protein